MRKLIPCMMMAAFLWLCCLVSAQADNYHFGGIYMTLDVPNTTYLLQLTPENLSANEAAIDALGETEESLRARFQEEGILLYAQDAANGRTLIVTAVQDDPGRTLYDINEQTADTRATYRRNHSDGTYCGAQGYKFESCEWKNFGDVQGRFLMLKYAQKVDGKTRYRGLWRRTIRNGYTITLDLRIEDRQVTAGDINALNKLQDSISFMQITDAPDAPLSLGFTAPPPEMTNDASFSIKGVTKPGARVIAAYASLKNSRSKVYTTMADGKGAFAIDVTLPSSDYYNIIVTAVAQEETEQEESVSREFSVEYDPTMIAVTFTTPFPDAFTEDRFKLTGTTLTGVTIQLIVNNELVTKKTGNSRTFAFDVDTSKEGTYEIQLSFTRKGFASKIMHYSIQRVMTEEQRREAMRTNSANIEYAVLAKNIAKYEGRILRFRGYAVDARENAGETIITFATSGNAEKPGHCIAVFSDVAVDIDPNSPILLYGTVLGEYRTTSEEGQVSVCPKMGLLFFDENAR